MSTYAIGDVQGCYDELQQLLALIEFDSVRDRLWFTGDLVNRGPDSLEVLRFVKSLGDKAITVLGNHDLHLLAIAANRDRPRRKDTLDDVLNAPDRDELLNWLRQQPLMHVDNSLGFVLIHAGLPPQWDLARAQACAHEVEMVLRGENYQAYFQQMYGNQPDSWRDDLGGMDRLRFITNCFTRLRYCDQNGRYAMEEKGSPGSQAEPWQPWFRIQDRASKGANIIFGHWSTLNEVNDEGIFALDSGCLWGGQLTALQLAPRLTVPPRRFHVECAGACQPGIA
ncbi:MAG: bis(5'-nucleosyl)-tetraphosphatase (symmetrical) ApaH [Gammaproteobacteria bacterium]|nr:MAG: bis(5'-nucleosyl)-tetraphosphatase (symmetrical) ApaH [Gammaproteobacteria bacterium]